MSHSKQHHAKTKIAWAYGSSSIRRFLPSAGRTVSGKNRYLEAGVRRARNCVNGSITIRTSGSSDLPTNSPANPCRSRRPGEKPIPPIYAVKDESHHNAVAFRQHLGIAGD